MTRSADGPVPLHAVTGPVPDASRLRLRSLVHLARVMAEPRPCDDLVEVASHEIRFALEAATVSVGRFDRDRGQVRVLVNVGELGPREEFRPRDEVYQIGDFPLMSLLIDEAQPWTVDASVPDADPAAVTLLIRSAKSFAMSAPVLLDGRVWGAIYVTRGSGGRPFDDDDVALLEALSAVMASGVAQATRVSLVERLAFEDPLTGLANRRAVDLRLEEALDARGSTGRPVSVVMADVNGLKVVNDEHGHEAGDRVLVAVGNAISIAVSQVPGGLAGRIGGDEFCVVLDGVDDQGALAVGQAMVDRLAEGAYSGALSCGVASTSLVPAAEPVSGRQLLRWADEAQYTAKRAHLRVPVLAGRDTMMLPAGERRRLRGSDASSTTTLPTTDSVQHALTAGLAAVVAAGPEPRLRLVRLLDAVCDALGGAGWVLSVTDHPSGESQTVAFAQGNEASRPEIAVPLAGDWLDRAAAAGVLSRRGDASVPLADLRLAGVVAAAVVDDWLLEVLGSEGAEGGPGEVGLDAVPAVLRALGSVAASG